MVMKGGFQLSALKVGAYPAPVLFHGIAVTVCQQVAELSHVRGAVVVAGNDDRPRPSRGCEAIQLRFPQLAIPFRQWAMVFSSPATGDIT